MSKRRREPSGAERWVASKRSRDEGPGGSCQNIIDAESGSEEDYETNLEIRRTVRFVESIEIVEES